jgi:hypothetical protein
MRIVGEDKNHLTRVQLTSTRRIRLPTTDFFECYAESTAILGKNEGAKVIMQ